MPTDDFFHSCLDQMINLHHPLAVLANRLPWPDIEAALAPAFERKDCQGEVLEIDDLFGTALVIAGGSVSAAGRPRLPIRLMASLLYLKHAFNLSDEEVVIRWSENVVWQYFSGQEYYTPELPCDATQIGRFRTTIGEAGVRALLKATIDTAVHTQAIKPAIGHMKNDGRLRRNWLQGTEGDAFHAILCGCGHNLRMILRKLRLLLALILVQLHWPLMNDDGPTIVLYLPTPENRIVQG